MEVRNNTVCHPCLIGKHIYHITYDKSNEKIFKKTLIE